MVARQRAGADDAAVTNVHEAVDLAGALVKLSRLVPVDARACLHSRFCDGIPERSRRPPACLGGEPGVAPVVYSELGCDGQLYWSRAFCAFVTYGPVLALTHEATEWLVR